MRSNREMRKEVRDTYITHPCSSGKETEVAATRIQTQAPQICWRQTQALLVSLGWGNPFLLPAYLLLRSAFTFGQCSTASMQGILGPAAASQVGASCCECSWEIPPNVPYKKEVMAALFDRRKSLTLRASARSQKHTFISET